MQVWKPTPKELRELAWEYIEECLANKKEIATATGVKKVADRHIPTIAYFLQIWIPLQGKKGICRMTYYRYLKEESEDPEKQAKSDTIKVIDEAFRSLAEDIVANEGKGIFYAKNRLGMTDKQELKHEGNVQVLSIDPLEGEENN